MTIAKDNPLTIPLAIIAAGIIVAGAIIFTEKDVGSNTKNLAATSATGIAGGKISLNAVDAADHLLGNPEALLTIVEYSDLECPFCKQFHQTMKQVLETYGKPDDGRVAWVYRHFPLDSLHSQARTEAEASECAAELGGEVKFWEFVDGIFKVTPSNNGLDLASLPSIAEKIGIDKKAFEDCVASGRHAERVKKDSDDAVRAGAEGTPYSVIIAKDGETTPIPGSLSFASMQTILDQILETTKK